MKDILSATISRQMFKDIAAGDVRSFSSEIRPNNCILFIKTDESGNPLFDYENGVLIPKHYDAVCFQHNNLFLKQSIMVSVEDIQIRVFNDGSESTAEKEGDVAPYLHLMVDITLGDLIPQDNGTC